MAATVEKAEILRGLKIYHAAGDVFEFRLPDAGKFKTIGGYFNDFDKAADEAITLSQRHPGLAIYCTINPTDASLLGRANNRTKAYAKNLTADRDIARLNWLPVDADPPRPAGISATDEEHDLSISRIRDIKKWLIEEQGWPERSIVIVDSGNGGYLLARIELENDLEGTKENTGLVAACLKALDYLFSDDSFHVDPTSQNPARILRVPGTLNAKGDEVDELAMKHRAAKILDAPNSFEVVPKSKLESLAAMLPVQEVQPKTYTGSNNGFDPVKYCQDHNLSVHHSKTWLDPKGQPCVVAVLDECIFNPDHHLSAVIIGWPNGARTYRCRHNSCLDKHWQDAKVKIEPFKSNFDANLSKLEGIKQEKIKQKFSNNEPETDITIPELEARIKSDPLILDDPAIIRFMAGLRANSRITFDLLIKSIKKMGTGVKVSTITDSLDAYDLENQKATASPTEPPEGISNEALVLIDSGKGYEYIYQVWQKRVKGNQHVGRALIVSRAVQSCLNAMGLHIYNHGKHAHGKSKGMSEAIKLLPDEFKMDEDISPLAIHYASKNGMLREGTTLLIDEMIWSDALGGIIKRVITRFQEGAGHLTVIDGEPVLARTQPRLAIWTNSADLHADEQLRDRFFDQAIDEGDEQLAAIMEFQKTRDTLPISAKENEKETAICQDIIRDLATKTFTVKIPFAERIDIAKSEGTRGYNIFSDLIKGFAILRYKQRQTDELGQLIATEDDFNNAKEVYEGSKGHSEQSYTTAEIKVLKAIIDKGYKATYKEIKEQTGLSEGRIREIVNGRSNDEQKRHGLRFKCPQLEIDRVDITIRTEEDADKYGHSFEKERRTRHINELTLPTSFSLSNQGKRNLVSLKPCCECCDPVVDVLYPKNNNKIDSVVVVVVEEKREEKKDTPPLSDANNEQSKKDGILFSSSIFEPKSPNTTTRNPLITNRGTTESSQHHNTPLEGSDSSLQQQLDRAAEEEMKRESHFKTPPKSKETIVCAVCGADLIVNGKIVKGHTRDNGKFYCAQPGCGYPKRGEEART